MILIGDITNKDLSEKLANHMECAMAYPDVHMFPDGEMRVRLDLDVAGKDVFLLKSVSSPVNDALIQALFIIDALRRNGARRINGIVPYLGYSRADHIFRPGEGVPLEVVISILEEIGLSSIMLVDPHSIKTPEVFRIPVSNQSALPLFAEKIREIEPDLSKISIVSPDMGGIRRIKILSELLGNVEYTVVDKERDLETGNIKINEIQGNLNETCFVVDDMIASGGTTMQAVEELYNRGVRHVYAMSTHAILADNASEKLQSSRVKKVFVTDSIAIPEENKFEKLEILSIAKTISSHILENYTL